MDEAFRNKDFTSTSDPTGCDLDQSLVSLLVKEVNDAKAKVCHVTGE